MTAPKLDYGWPVPRRRRDLDERTLAERAADGPWRAPEDWAEVQEDARHAGIPGWRACVACAVVGLGIGIGGSHWWPWGPWGFAPAPPAQGPQVGELLVAGPDSAMVRDVTGAEHGDRTATVLWLRGARTGVTTVRITGCPRNEGHVIFQHAMERWRGGGGGIFDLIGRAACAADLQPAPGAGRTTWSATT